MDAADVMLLFLAAREGRTAELEEALGEAAALPADDPASAFVRLRNDPFRDFVPGVRGFEGTLELPIGRGTEPDALRGLAKRLDALVHRDLSAVVAGREIEWVAGGPAPVRYQYLMRRRHDFDHARYLAHYGSVHADIGVRTPGKRGYSQVHVDLGASQRAAAELGFGVWQIDSVSRLWIDSPEEFLGAAGSVGQEAIEDERNFVDGANSVMFASRPLP